MSIINFNLLSQTVDMRIVKTKKSIFRALLVLLQNNPITEITITDVCRLAMINRKTFYSHYESPFDAFLDMEGMIIRGYISELKSRHVIFASSFQASQFIYVTHALIQDELDDFHILYPYFRNGAFIRNFGITLGKEVSNYFSNNPAVKNIHNYIFSYVFSLTGLLVSYFDWIDSEYPVSLEQLANTVDKAFSLPLQNSLQL